MLLCRSTLKQTRKPSASSMPCGYIRLIIDDKWSSRKFEESSCTSILFSWCFSHGIIYIDADDLPATYESPFLRTSLWRSQLFLRTSLWRSQLCHLTALWRAACACACAVCLCCVLMLRLAPGCTLDYACWNFSCFWLRTVLPLLYRSISATITLI